MKCCLLHRTYYKCYLEKSFVVFHRVALNNQQIINNLPYQLSHQLICIGLWLFHWKYICQNLFQRATWVTTIFSATKMNNDPIFYTNFFGNGWFPMGKQAGTLDTRLFLTIYCLNGSFLKHLAIKTETYASFTKYTFVFTVFVCKWYKDHSWYLLEVKDVWLRALIL